MKYIYSSEAPNFVKTTPAHFSGNMYLKIPGKKKSEKYQGIFNLFLRQKLTWGV